jgi:hypothetical protein
MVLLRVADAMLSHQQAEEFATISAALIQMHDPENS